MPPIDIVAEYERAKAEYSAAAEALEQARTNGQRLSSDPKISTRAEAEFRAAREAAARAYEAVDELEKIAKRRMEREKARSARQAKGQPAR